MYFYGHFMCGLFHSNNKVTVPQISLFLLLSYGLTAVQSKSSLCRVCDDQPSPVIVGLQVTDQYIYIYIYVRTTFYHMSWYPFTVEPVNTGCPNFSAFYYEQVFC